MYLLVITVKYFEGENQKGISDISPTLQESQNKHFTIVWSDIVYWFQLL